MKFAAATFLLTFGSVGAFAATEPLQPAPVPNIGDGHVAPADRAGSSNSAEHQAPFAGEPTNLVAGQGQVNPTTEASKPNDAAPVPNLSK